MKHLYLIRHAKSSWSDDSLRDHERPLNNRGLNQLGPMGKAVRAEGALKGAVYCSNATRAIQTLEGLMPQDSRENVHIAPVIYTFNHEVLLDWLRGREEDSITLIGHNPALEDLAGFLLKHPPENIPTCGFMHISLPIKRWDRLAKNTGRLEQFLTPKDISYKQFNRKRKKIMTAADSPLARHIPEALQHQYQRMRDLEAGVIRGYDDEFLHQYRIAIRRSRAITESVNEISADAEVRKAVKTLKRHARATSHLRDLHVFLGDLEHWLQQPEYGKALASSGAHSYFENLANREHLKLVRRLTSRKYHKDMDHWSNLITSRHFKKITRKLATGDIRNALNKRIERYNSLLRQLNHESPDEAVHTLRKLLKRIRYLAELDKPAFGDMLKELKRYQQRFGDFQDLHVQIDMLQAFRDSISTEPGMLESVAGLNNLIASLGAEKTSVRDEILTFGDLDGHSVL
ncbi:CHAD domain-containing protein [Marinobacter sp. HL-58]|uniref:CHAD domain-containing protein n=1 Tax=Marinobacter sp. HL-58 TaxID=1479237 RepID=UPI000482813D|nr:CHAD domain-containing protein [Marinobacter sp. HL-58]KPQ00227.1 MAG: phosphohistidine phosphatase SixA [Marinobacter sp. HL-58]